MKEEVDEEAMLTRKESFQNELRLDQKQGLSK
jgi:hypothetical protein